MKYAPYQNYKPGNSGWLRELPDTWQQIRCRFVMGVNPSPVRLRDLDGADEVSFVPMEAVGEYAGLNLDAKTAQIDELVRLTSGGGSQNALAERKRSLAGLLLEYRQALITAAVTGKIDVRGTA